MTDLILNQFLFEGASVRQRAHAPRNRQCLGSHGGPRGGVVVSYERDTPVDGGVRERAHAPRDGRAARNN